MGALSRWPFAIVEVMRPTLSNGAKELGFALMSWIGSSLSTKASH